MREVERPVGCVVGYDCRVELPAEGASDPEWGPERRAVFLLREDVESPLSADGSVWREQFLNDEIRDLPLERLWPVDLKAVCEALERSSEAATLVCLTEHCEEAHHPAATPPTVPEGATLLGYDVVDPAGVSCLMNFGYLERPHEVRRLREQFLADLDRHHLFRAEDRARAFGEFMESVREPDSGPYCVIGLHALGLRGAEPA